MELQRANWGGQLEAGMTEMARAGGAWVGRSTPTARRGPPDSCTVPTPMSLSRTTS